MLLLLTLRNVVTGECRTVEVNDMVSPCGGYTQSYVDRVGRDYASDRATEQLRGKWEYVRGCCVANIVRSNA